MVKVPPMVIETGRRSRSMREYLKILLVGLALSVAGAVLAVQAAEAAVISGRAQATPAGVTENAPLAPKAPTCRPRWPYIVKSCVA